MKKLFLLAAVVASVLAATPTGVAASSDSTLNPILNQIPMLEGPDRRNVCVISDQLDRSWCFYVTIP